ncbi:hypothetical protein GOODEAATRI_006471 [Goodea atripinnis]|uniref:Uncharacterized protein n=1 Tax=Goodea atripinnis TaxID=208336 RepID=A0ABV0PW86_9TELE
MSMSQARNMLSTFKSMNKIKEFRYKCVILNIIVDIKSPSNMTLSRLVVVMERRLQNQVKNSPLELGEWYNKPIKTLWLDTEKVKSSKELNSPMLTDVHLKYIFLNS